MTRIPPQPDLRPANSWFERNTGLPVFLPLIVIGLATGAAALYKGTVDAVSLDSVSFDHVTLEFYATAVWVAVFLGLLFGLALKGAEACKLNSVYIGMPLPTEHEWRRQIVGLAFIIPLLLRLGAFGPPNGSKPREEEESDVSTMARYYWPEAISTLLFLALLPLAASWGAPASSFDGIVTKMWTITEGKEACQLTIQSGQRSFGVLVSYKTCVAFKVQDRVRGKIISESSESNPDQEKFAAVSLELFEPPTWRVLYLRNGSAFWWLISLLTVSEFGAIALGRRLRSNARKAQELINH